MTKKTLSLLLLTAFSVQLHANGEMDEAAKWFAEQTSQSAVAADESTLEREAAEVPVDNNDQVTTSEVTPAATETNQNLVLEELSQELQNNQIAQQASVDSTIAGTENTEEAVKASQNATVPVVADEVQAPAAKKGLSALVDTIKNAVAEKASTVVPTPAFELTETLKQTAPTIEDALRVVVSAPVPVELNHPGQAQAVAAVQTTANQGPSPVDRICETVKWGIFGLGNAAYNAGYAVVQTPGALVNSGRDLLWGNGLDAEVITPYVAKQDTLAPFAADEQADMEAKVRNIQLDRIAHAATAEYLNPKLSKIQAQWNLRTALAKLENEEDRETVIDRMNALLQQTQDSLLEAVSQAAHSRQQLTASKMTAAVDNVRALQQELADNKGYYMEGSTGLAHVGWTAWDNKVATGAVVAATVATGLGIYYFLAYKGAVAATAAAVAKAGADAADCVREQSAPYIASAIADAKAAGIAQGTVAELAAANACTVEAVTGAVNGTVAAALAKIKEVIPTAAVTLQGADGAEGLKVDLTQILTGAAETVLNPTE